MTFLIWRPWSMAELGGWEQVAGPVAGKISCSSGDLPVSQVKGRKKFCFRDFEMGPGLFQFFDVHSISIEGEYAVFNRTGDFESVYWCRLSGDGIFKIGAPRKYSLLRIIQQRAVIVSNSDSLSDVDAESIGASSSGFRTLVYSMEIPKGDSIPVWDTMWSIEEPIFDYDIVFDVRGGRRFPTPELVYTSGPAAEEPVLLGRLGIVEAEILLPSEMVPSVVECVRWLPDSYVCSVCSSGCRFKAVIGDLPMECLISVTDVSFCPGLGPSIFDLCIYDEDSGSQIILLSGAS
ncbi:hypothetical protein FOZ63_032944, partial [Perkinsus olseni]